MGDRERYYSRRNDSVAKENSGEILLRSSLWETAPVDCHTGSPPFLNASLRSGQRPNETPESLFAKLQALEKNFGRKPKDSAKRAAPRLDS